MVSTPALESPTDVSTLEKLPDKLKLNEVEKLVREEFFDIPVLIEIARCESQYRQFNPDGSVLRGIINPLDVGVMQVNEHYHLEASEHLNIDIYTLKGNMDYSRVLYEQSGTTPWNASKECWLV